MGRTLFHQNEEISGEKHRSRIFRENYHSNFLTKFTFFPVKSIFLEVIFKRLVRIFRETYWRKCQKKSIKSRS